jgi:PAS domain-containing protein
MIESSTDLCASLRDSLPQEQARGILARILSASSDACWCMDFGVPVDLTAPDHEVVRQVFENDPFWRFANPAMAQLYLLDQGEAFTARPVSEIFPRNRQNEEFVLNLLANGFEVDAAPALDRRYDGVEIYVENDVRADIEGGRLMRMFGIVRDVGKHHRREIELQRRLDSAIALLSVVETPLIAVNPDRHVAAINAAAAALFGRQMEDCLGLTIADLFWPDAGGAAPIAGSGGATRDAAGRGWAVAERPDGGAILRLGAPPPEIAA